MNTITFKYTKKDGSVSDRVLLVSTSPTKFYAGTDVSEMQDNSREEYIERRKVLHTEYLAKLAELDDDFDVNYRYRQFDSQLMTNIK